MPSIFAEIPVDGTWPSPEDMDARNAIIDELDALDIGEFEGAGGGLGSMDFSFAVQDAVAAEKTIRQVVAKHLPNRPYEVRVSDD